VHRKSTNKNVFSDDDKHDSKLSEESPSKGNAVSGLSVKITPANALIAVTFENDDKLVEALRKIIMYNRQYR